MISPIPRYNSSYLNNSVTHGRNSPGVIGASNMLSPALGAGKSSTISRAGASILNNSNQNLQFTRTSNSKLLPNSFKTALEEVEDEINALAAEVAFQRKECLIMKSEQDTYTDIAKAQHQDIERYLAKECKILDNVSQTQQKRQDTEFSRLHGQVNHATKIVKELDDERMECVRKLVRVQTVLGVKTDPNEAFMQPLVSSQC